MNIAGSLRATARRLPDKAALIFESRSVTYARLDARVDAAAAALQSDGLRAGDRILLLLGNVPDFIETFYGALRAGLVVVPVNPSSTAAEIAHVLGDSRARAAVVGEVAAGAFAQACTRAELTPESVFVVAEAGGGVERRGWRQAVDAAMGVRPTPAALPADAMPTESRPAGLALLGYTSGTTGTPKGAKLSHANLLANQRQLDQTLLRVEERDVVLCALPLFHIYALNVAMAHTLARGATVLLVERFDARDTLLRARDRRASVIVGTPAMYGAWTDLPDLSGHDLASVRIATSGAAPLSPAVFESFRDAFGIVIWEGYGLTETSPVLTSSAMGTEPVPGSVGRPLPDVAIRLLDRDGRPVRGADPGEVVVRGPNVFSGYWGQPTATAAVLDDDGWFRTGDIGYWEAGNLRLVDRKDDLIIVRGFNVYPREVEDVLSTHRKVAESAVVGVPDHAAGEAVRAVVVLHPGQQATAEELIAHCRASLARFKCPVTVAFATELPRAPGGKIKRRALREAP